MKISPDPGPGCFCLQAGCEVCSRAGSLSIGAIPERDPFWTNALREDWERSISSAPMRGDAGNQSREEQNTQTLHVCMYAYFGGSMSAYAAYMECLGPLGYIDR